jgi:uridine kinase
MAGEMIDLERHLVMASLDTSINSNAFTVTLFEKMKLITPGIRELELYEFRYCLKELLPEDGWESVALDSMEDLEMRLNDRSFYDRVQITPRVDNRIVLDPQALRLAQMLFVGMVTGKYPLEWVNVNFYFDTRGFFFLHRTLYFTEKILAHLGGKPYRQFEQRQRKFEEMLEVGYKAFKEANAEVDRLFVQSVMKIIATRGTPCLLAIAGPTAAGKTEIVERLCEAFTQAGHKVTSIELDNFLTDRDYREAMGIDSQGKAAIHFELFRQSLEDIAHGKKIFIPYYDTVYATSSHSLDGILKPGRKPIEIEPADIIFIEGNFPFLLEEVLHLIGIKVVYLTDDPVRMKRKWRRDIDFHKKYDATYFRNRFFKDQFIMAEIAYLPQMEVCDMVVDTTGAALWTTPEIAGILDQS